MKHILLYRNNLICVVWTSIQSEISGLIQNARAKKRITVKMFQTHKTESAKPTKLAGETGWVHRATSRTVGPRHVNACLYYPARPSSPTKWPPIYI